ncbi:MAG: glycerophosphodiester phosphodiesterase [Armatimonadota bacterium]|nr:glycerophosphodiester phosphodiesterase [Armatimonadota bacterium]
MPHHRIEVTGHRGAAAVEPENTLRGIRHALALQVNRVEIDVHLCKDGELVVMHDAAVDRTTDGTGKIADLTLAEIKQLNAGQGERVPTLQEVLDAFKEAWSQGSQTLLQIELKGVGTAEPTVDAIRRNDVEDRIVLTSFDAPRLTEAKRLLPQARSGLLTGTLDPDPIEIARRIPTDAVHLRHDLATREWVERVHAAGLEARVWNIDEAERMKWAIALGVDGIGSNNPQLLIEVLAEHGA